MHLMYSEPKIPPMFIALQRKGQKRPHRRPRIRSCVLVPACPLNVGTHVDCRQTYLNLTERAWVTFHHCKSQVHDTTMLAAWHWQKCGACGIDIIPRLNGEFIAGVQPLVAAKLVLADAIRECDDKSFLVARRIARSGAMDWLTCAMKLAIDEECCVVRTKMHVHNPHSIVPDQMRLPAPLLSSNPFVFGHASGAIAHCVFTRFHVGAMFHSMAPPLTSRTTPRSGFNDDMTSVYPMSNCNF